MRTKGKITSWNDEKGYGFIAPIDGGAQIFIHIKALRDNNRRPTAGDVVTYSIATDKQGRFRADNAALSGARTRRRSERHGSTQAILFSLALLGAVGISANVTKLPIEVLGTYFVLSAIAFVAYAIDKSSAQRGGWRISEATLQLLALFGGWPGALVAQKVLRHKTIKVSFQVVFWLVVLTNVAGLIWLHSVAGRLFLERLLS